MAANDYTLNISIGRPQVVGIDPGDRELIRIRVPLTPEPTDPWLQVFAHGAPGVSYAVSMHPPTVEAVKMQPPTIVGHDEVMLRCPDGEIEHYLASLRERVEWTNVYYNREIAPQIQRGREEREAAHSEEQRRLSEARLRLENLS
jgi:hypothetical protein